MSFSKYPAYKDSGVEWLGEVPAHWCVAPTGSKYNIRNGHPFSAELFSSESHPENRVIRIRDLLHNNSPVYSNEICPASALIQNGDILVGMDGDFNVAVWTEGRAKLNQRVCAIESSNEYWDKYLYYGIQAPLRIINDLTFSTTVKHLSSSQILKIKFPFPPAQELRAIVRFIDHETAKIDTLIKEQQRLIGLLKEKRQAVITHAVTKGLDPNTPMKDSGVEWLGKVPRYWEIIPLKHLMRLNPVKSAFTGDPTQLCSFVPMEKLKTGQIVLDEERVIADVFDGYTYFEDGDVLQAKVTPCFENKNIALATQLKNGVGFGSTEINVCRPNNLVISQFLFYRLQEDIYMNVCTASMTGAGGLKRVPTETIEEFRVALPDIREQSQIVRYLDKAVKNLDDLTAYATKAIDLLHERRVALISAAVTGKIDVRDWQPPTSSTPTHYENTMEVA